MAPSPPTAYSAFQPRGRSAAHGFPLQQPGHGFRVHQPGHGGLHDDQLVQALRDAKQFHDVQPFTERSLATSTRESYFRPWVGY